MKKTLKVFRHAMIAACVFGLLEPRIAQAPQKQFRPFKFGCERPLRINIFGDIYITEDKVTPSAKLFRNLRPMLGWAQFNVANFEGVVSEYAVRSFPDFPFALKISPLVPKLLNEVGIKHLTRANNHSMDFGLQGLNDTSTALQAAGLAWAGVGNNLAEAYKPMFFEQDGTRVGIVSLNMTYPKGAWATETTPGVAYPVLESLRIALDETRRNVDFLFVVFHWGEELTARPRSYQPELASFVIKNGADAVFGAHTHVAQGTEVIDNKPVAYGLGNFVFTALSELANFSLASHVEICFDRAKGKRKMQVAFTPLDTLNRQTGYATRPMHAEQFKTMVAPYVKANLFSPDTLFYFPERNETKSLASWTTILNIVPN